MELLITWGVFLIVLLISVFFGVTIVLLPDYRKIEIASRELSDYEYSHEDKETYFFTKKEVVKPTKMFYYNFNEPNKEGIGYFEGYDLTLMGFIRWGEYINPYLYYLRKKVEKRIFAVLERSYIEETK